jgi:hypothetical protein
MECSKIVATGLDEGVVARQCFLAELHHALGQGDGLVQVARLAQLESARIKRERIVGLAVPRVGKGKSRNERQGRRPS